MAKGIRVNVYLTAEENDMLKMAAMATNTKKATALRKMAFLKIKNFQALKEIEPKLIAAITELGRQGTNLNQIARRLNTLKDQYPTDEIFNAIFTANETALAFHEIRTFFGDVLTDKWVKNDS